MAHTDGRIIVGELDGTAKYVDPKMTDRRSIQETVQAEREREQALFSRRSYGNCQINF